MNADVLFSKFPTLHTERLTLREMTADDADAVFALYSDHAVAKFMDIDEMTERQQAVDLLKAFREGFEARALLRWGVTLRDGDGTVIGTCNIMHVNAAFHFVEIGYDLAPAYWRRGFATEAVREALRFCYDDAGVNRVEAMASSDNEASKRFLEKLGFTQEGLLRQRAFDYGKYEDLYIYSLLKSEWNANSPA